MKRFVSALALCSSLTILLTFWLFPSAAAKEDPIITLLNLPAPPPPNPLVKVPSGTRPASFYDKNKPPPDNAPIEDLMEYWSKMSSGYQELAFNPKPSSMAASRIMHEIESDPERIAEFLNILQDDRRAADIAREQFRKIKAGDDEDDAGSAEVLKSWLTANTPDFSDELERTAQKITDTGEYVSSQDDLLNLTRVDWGRAAPIVNRMYADKGQKTSQVLATWALYRKALSDGGSDADKYRDELKAVVESKEATDGMRDLALDALVKEKEWSGRDDWYLSLLEDETLADLRVDGRTFTGLTTIMYHTPDDRLTDRMIVLMGSDNIAVRTAAAKNLLLRLGRSGEGSDEIRKGIVTAMLPWLTDKKWIRADAAQRAELVRSFQYVKLPDAVPALIAALDEKESMTVPAYATNTVANMVNAPSNLSRDDYEVYASNMAVANARDALDNAARQIANAANMASTAASGRDYYPLRSSAITALAYQKDGRAAPALRRVLVEVEEWERTSVVKALLDCNGFATEEKVAALEFMARSGGDLDEELSESANSYVYGSTARNRARMAMRTAIAEHSTTVAKAAEDVEAADAEFENYHPPATEMAETTGNGPEERYDVDSAELDKALTEDDLKFLVASQLAAIEDPDEGLVRGTVDRIEALTRREPAVSQALRKIVLGWNGTAVNAMILRDIKIGNLDADAILKMLAIRKELREKQSSDVAAMAAGVPAAAAIAACILENRADYDAVLANGSDTAKTALFACGRLIRAEFSLEKVLSSLKSPNTILAVAAERYLESEDSSSARAAVLSLYPNQAKILGATTSFRIDGLESIPGTFLRDIFRSVNPYFGSEEYAYLTFMHDAEFAGVEKRLRKEVIGNPDLLGVYAYDKHFVRIFKDKAVFSWEDDPARYRERVLEPPQFESLKSYLTSANVDSLPPFLACSSECESKELLMIARNGGRRVFLKGDRKLPAFFAALQTYFDEMKRQPSQLKYYAEVQVPGLEVMFADEKLAAATMWKQGADLRVLVTDDARERAIMREVDAASELELKELQSEGKNTDSHYSKFYELRGTRRFESYAWYELGDGRLGSPTTQPAGAEYIPPIDNVMPAPSFGQWSAKAQNFEIRADNGGLYKVAGGRSVRIRIGNYSLPIVTANGRWAIATKSDTDGGMQLVRVNLLNNREYKIASDEYPLQKAICYIAGRNWVLAAGYDESEHEDYDENYNESAYDNGLGYFVINPDTGAVYPASGEVRPLAQQTFRGLQATGTPGEFWAAIPRGKAGTMVGIYSTRNLSFKPLLKLPKIIFDSTEMWVAAAESKFYFIHDGHLLRANLPALPAVTPPRRVSRRGDE